MSLSPRSVEWTAGFLEGEGSFNHPISKATTFVVSAAQVQREPLDRLSRLYGGSIYWKRKNDRGPNGRWSDIYVWTLTGSVGAGLAMTIFQLMSPRRQDQISLALRRWRSRSPQNKYKMACPKGHPFDLENTRHYVNPRTGKRGRWCRACRRGRTA